jgi:hypothetical protein
MNSSSKRKQLQSKGFQHLYSSPDMLEVMKSRRTMWAGYVARMDENGIAHCNFVSNPQFKTPFSDLDVSGKIILT